MRHGDKIREDTERSHVTEQGARRVKLLCQDCTYKVGF